jgi:hypothetical protein
MTVVPAWAQEAVAGGFVALEGGAACPFGDETGFIRDEIPHTAPGLLFDHRSGLALGDESCGWTGRIGFGQSAPGAFFGLAGFWGLYVRHTEMKTDSDQSTLTTNSLFLGTVFPNYTGPVSGRYDENRTVIDFEVGQDAGLGVPGLDLQVIGGLRYARFKSGSSIEAETVGPPGYYFYTIDLQTKTEFNGLGPRIGIRGSVALGQGFGLMFTASAAALYGSRDANSLVTVFESFSLPAGGTLTTRFDSDGRDWVGSFDGEAAITVQPFASGGGELALGVRAELWIDQVRDHGAPRGQDLDRYFWGPFARYTIWFDGP